MVALAAVGFYLVVSVLAAIRRGTFRWSLLQSSLARASIYGVSVAFFLWAGRSDTGLAAIAHYIVPSIVVTELMGALGVLRGEGLSIDPAKLVDPSQPTQPADITKKP